MKALLLGVMRDGTGYANAGIDTALSMQSAGIDVVCRSISMTQPKDPNSGIEIKEFEQKDLNNIDAVIQLCLPHTFEKISRAKCIGYFYYETTCFRNSGWHNYCNLMDQTWVPCIQQKQTCIDSQVVNPIKIVPNGCNPAKFEKQYRSLNLGDVAKNKCVFYCIAENNRRKNFASLIRSYYLAFQKNEDVLLIIKTNGNINQMIMDIRKSIHPYCNDNIYPKILVISNHMANDDICALHQAGDIFVTASKGEGWNIGCHDALGFGNPVIVPNWGSHHDLLCDNRSSCFDPIRKIFKNTHEIDAGWLVGGLLTPCFGMQTGIKNLYNGTELWFETDILDMAKCMTAAYNRWTSNQLGLMKDNAKRRAMNFSYEKVGHIIKKELEAILQ